MAIKDPIKEIIDKFENEISFLKKEREEALDNFKNVVHVRKIEDLKTSLKTDVISKFKK